MLCENYIQDDSFISSHYCLNIEKQHFIDQVFQIKDGEHEEWNIYI